MKNGVFLVLKNQWGNILRDLLAGIPVDDYCWRISQTQIIDHADDDAGKDLPYEAVLSGKELASYYTDVEDYLLLFCVLFAFPDADSIVDLVLPQDYVKSDCEITILIYDARYVEVYAKDDDTLKKFLQNIAAIQTEAVKYYIDEESPRHGMSV